MLNVPRNVAWDFGAKLDWSQLDLGTREHFLDCSSLLKWTKIWMATNLMNSLMEAHSKQAALAVNLVILKILLEINILNSWELLSEPSNLSSWTVPGQNQQCQTPSMFWTPSRPHSLCQEDTSTAFPVSSGWTPGSAGRTSESAGPTNYRSQKMNAGGQHRSRPLQEHALAEVLNGLTGQLNRVVSHLDRQEKRMEFKKLLKQVSVIERESSFGC